MWLGILSGLYAIPALLVLAASLGQALSAGRRGRLLGAFGWLCIAGALLTGRHWVRRLRPAAADEPKPLKPDRSGAAMGAGGVRLEWEQFGPDDAPAILLSHGWSLSHQTWYYQKALADEFRVIVWDLRGTGRSSAPRDRDYSFAAMTADLAAVFEAADAGRHPSGCILAGHSVGAMLLPLLAAERPDLMRSVGGLALLGGTDSPMLETMRGRRALTALRFVFWEPLARAMAFAPGPFEVFVRLMSQMGCVHLALMFGTNGGQDSRGQNDLIARRCAEFSMRAAGLGALACFAYDGRAALAQVTVPALILTGEHDNNMPPDTQRAMAGRLPNAELVLLKHCGHLALLECHEEVNAHLRDFARRCLVRSEEARK